MSTEYSFCESIHATSTSPWHIRRLTDAGRKPGGGIDTKSLCGHVERGWDLNVKITSHHLEHACPRCMMHYLGELLRELFTFFMDPSFISLESIDVDAGTFRARWWEPVPEKHRAVAGPRQEFEVQGKLLHVIQSMLRKQP